MPRTSRQPLSLQRIVDVALRVVDQDGLDALTMRRLGRDLGVEPMSLYHWVPSRAHLLDALLDHFLAELPPLGSGTWQDQLRVASHAFRKQAQRHPSLVPFVVIHRFNTKTALGVLERFLGALAKVHPNPRQRAAAFRLWIHWLIGFCLDESSGFSKGPSAQSPPSDEEISRDYPHVAELGPFNKPEHFTDLFERGLDAILEAMDGRSLP